jgi:hypothetical protein
MQSLGIGVVSARAARLRCAGPPSPSASADDVLLMLTNCHGSAAAAAVLSRHFKTRGSIWCLGLQINTEANSSQRRANRPNPRPARWVMLSSSSSLSTTTTHSHHHRRPSSQCISNCSLPAPAGPRDQRTSPRRRHPELPACICAFSPSNDALACQWIHSPLAPLPVARSVAPAKAAGLGLASPRTSLALAHGTCPTQHKTKQPPPPPLLHTSLCYTQYTHSLPHHSSPSLRLLRRCEQFFETVPTRRCILSGARLPRNFAGNQSTAVFVPRGPVSASKANLNLNLRHKLSFLTTPPDHHDSHDNTPASSRRKSSLREPYRRYRGRESAALDEGVRVLRHA